MEYNRSHYSNDGYLPFLFYVLFGVSPEKLQLSRSKHKVEKIPDGIDIVYYTKSEHKDYIDGFLSGSLGEIIKKDVPQLYEKTLEQNDCVVIRGEIQEDTDLLYMRNIVGIIQAFTEIGAVSILDIQMLKLYSPDEWTNEIFIKDFDPYIHSVILISEMDNGLNWLHTRGMIKFGRPDISILDVPAEDIKKAQQVVNQLIFYGVQGAIYKQPIKIHTYDKLSYIITPLYIEDFDNFDFNNAYYQMSWKDCKVCK